MRNKAPMYSPQPQNRLLPLVEAAAVERGIDALLLLTAQQCRLEDLLHLLVDAAAVGTVRRAALEEAGDELALLIGAKEAVLYPAARAARTDDILLEAQQAHLAMQRLLATVLRLPAGDDRLHNHCSLLLQWAERHHQDDEVRLFPALREVAGPERRAELGQQLQHYQAELRRRGRPHLSVLRQVDADDAV